MYRKKLCILTPCHWSSAMGGAEYQVKSLLDRLIPLDRFEITYLARDYDPSFQPRDYRIEGICNGDSSSMAYGAFFLDAPRLWKSLHRIRPDVILQRVGCAYTGVAAHYAVRNKCNMVFHVSIDNDILLKAYDRKIVGKSIHRIEYLFIDYALKHCPHIITQTHQQAVHLKERYHRVPAAVVPNFHRVPEGDIRKTDPIKVVWVANFKPSKQPELFVRLADALGNSRGGLQCIMIGAPYPGAGKQSEIAREIERAQNLHYLGALPVEQVNAILEQAHIFVNTSYCEGFPNTFIQAWMRKAPVVSLQWDPDGVIRRQRLGFVAGTFERLVEQVLYLADNGPLRERMGQRAQAYAFEKHSDLAIDEYVRILNGG
ncbi:MAG: glycosyltransferase family 4 protein [Syntrophobacteraceae bacterium]|nr:glycosyltransferase family 4 protein [Desulfobacteraceae bacterium]